MIKERLKSLTIGGPCRNTRRPKVVMEEVWRKGRLGEAQEAVGERLNQGRDNGIGEEGMYS